MVISLAPLSQEPNAIIFPAAGFLYLLLIRNGVFAIFIGSMAEADPIALLWLM